MSSKYNSAAARRVIRRRQDQQIADARIQTSSLAGGFGAPLPLGDGTAFGASAPAVANNNANGTGSALHGSTNSFPPAQSTAPSANFSSSSFPAFGAGNQSIGFNPPAPAANFNNPFATNGNASTAFGGAATFGAPPVNNSFQQNNSGSTNGMFGAITTAFGSESNNHNRGFDFAVPDNSAPSSCLFTTSAAPATSMFASAATPSTNAFTPSTTNAFTPAPSTMFSNYGASQNNAPAQNPFGFGSNAQQSEPQQETQQQTFWGPSSQGNNAFTTPATSQFNIPSAATSAAPAQITFGGFDQNAQQSKVQQNSFGGFGQNAQKQQSEAQQQIFQQNPFGGTSQGTASLSAPTTGHFDFRAATSAAPDQIAFSGFGSNGDAQQQISQQSFLNTTSQGNATFTAPTTSRFSFGANATSTAPAQNAFTGFGASVQQETPQQTFSQTSSQSSGNGAFTAPATSQSTSFGANVTSAEPALQMFGKSTTLSNPFGDLPRAEATSTPKNGLFSDLALPAESEATPKPSLFSSVKVPEKTQETLKTPLFSSVKVPEKTQETPKTSLFSSVKVPEKTQETPKTSLFSSVKAPALATSSSGFSIFGAAQKNAVGSEAAEQSSTNATSTAGAPATSTLKSTSDFNSPHSSYAPNNVLGANAHKMTPPFNPSRSTPVQTPKEAPKEATVPSSLFAPAKQSTTPSPSPMTTLAGAPTLPATNTSDPELPQIPKAHVPKDWGAPSAGQVNYSDSLYNIIKGLTTQLLDLNVRYRTKMMSLSPTADWSALSLWHHQHSSALKNKIDVLKKQRAAMKGITGNESSLSTKRKVNDDSPEDRNASPSKRARPSEVPTTPTPQPSTATPRMDPPVTSTSNLFANVIKVSPPSTSLFSPKAAEPSMTEPSKNSTPFTGFTSSTGPSTGAANPFSTSTFKPSTHGTTASVSGGFTSSTGPATGAANPFSASTFKPSTNDFSSSSGYTSSTSPATGTAGPFSASTFKPSITSASAGASGGFKPTTAGSSSGGFASQFASQAKTYEQLAAERKKKAKDDDYDSDDETYEEWSAKYDEQEAARLAKEKAESSVITGFSLSAAVKTSGTATPEANPFAGLSKSVSGTSTANGLFGSRAASPAPSTGSVFDAPSTTDTASPNIFGHLSSDASSNHHGDSDDEGEQADETSQHVQPGSGDSTSSKRKLGAFDSQAEEPAGKKQDTAPKSSLMSRMTRTEDAGSESKKENTISSSLFFQANGTSTPANKPKPLFDFVAAGAQTAPPKSDTFAGDQTFKVGTPIKFGNGPSTEQKAPTFQFQPPSTSTTPSKPPPSNPFTFGAPTSGPSLLAPNTGLSGLNSAPSSTFSSRDATPEAGAASVGDDDEEASKEAQADLSKLTADELKANNVVFETEQALAKRQVEQDDGTKSWENFARGPLYILKDKATGKCIIRIRLANGQVPLNYQILPALKASVIGSSGKMVSATFPKKDGGIAPVYLSVKTPELAKEFALKYNESLPS
jgi:hypothetical protein